jgi:hypothetical protein
MCILCSGPFLILSSRHRHQDLVYCCSISRRLTPASLCQDSHGSHLCIFSYFHPAIVSKIFCILPFRVVCVFIFINDLTLDESRRFSCCKQLLPILSQQMKKCPLSHSSAIVCVPAPCDRHFSNVNSRNTWQNIPEGVQVYTEDF